MTTEAAFLAAHASGAQWRDAAGEIILALQPVTAAHRLGFLYVTDHYAQDLKDISIFLRQTLTARVKRSMGNWDLIRLRRSPFQPRLAPASKTCWPASSRNCQVPRATRLRRSKAWSSTPISTSIEE